MQLLVPNINQIWLYFRNRPAEQNKALPSIFNIRAKKIKRCLNFISFCCCTSSNYVASVLTEEMPKRFLWNQLTAFSEANPLQIKLERKATGKIMDTKSGHNIFFSKHPCREEIKPPTVRKTAATPWGEYWHTWLSSPRWGCGRRSCTVMGMSHPPAAALRALSSRANSPRSTWLPVHGKDTWALGNVQGFAYGIHWLLTSC